MPLESRAPVRGSQRPGVRLPVHARDALPTVRRLVHAPQPGLPEVPFKRFSLPLRLRHLVWLSALALGAQSIVPRAVAYWQLHDVAAQVANYALCMAGPTGADLLRERPSGFWQLVRRRLIASPPEGRPFAQCVPALQAFSKARITSRHHLAQAQDFREYAALGSGKEPELSLADMGVTTEPLDTLMRAAWPLARHGYADMMRSERNALAVTHPSELPRPAEGRGLPPAQLGYATLSGPAGEYLLVAGRGANVDAYRSRDGGLSWGAVDVDNAAVRANSGRCGLGGSTSSFRLGTSDDQLRIESWVASELETSFPIASADSHLLGFSCDTAAALAWLEVPGQVVPAFRLCPRQARCRDLPAPEQLRGTLQRAAVVSAARVRGATVVAMSLLGIVRVVSSRDDGETWTPPVVAYDHEEYGRVGSGRETPTRLLALDGRVLLYAGADSPTSSYPALISDDLGASWHGR